MSNNSEQYRFECECREWIRLARKHGRGWWDAQKISLRKRRGQAGLDKLLAGMEQERRRNQRQRTSTLTTTRRHP